MECSLSPRRGWLDLPSKRVAYKVGYTIRSLRIQNWHWGWASTENLSRMRDGKAFQWEPTPASVGRKDGIRVSQDGEKAFLCRVEGSLEVTWL